MYANGRMTARRSGLWAPERFADDDVPLSPAVRRYIDAEMLYASGTGLTSEGDAFAVHTAPNGVKHPVNMTAHASGHLRGTIPTYSWWRPFTAGSANERIIDIFNASGSGVEVKLRKLFLHHNGSVVTGVPHLFDFIHTTAVGTGGTVLTGRKQDSAEAAIPAQVTVRMEASGGATESFVRFGFSVDTEETRPGTQLAPMINWLPEGEDIGDIVLHEGEGALVKQITSSTVGVWGCWLIASILTI